MSCAVGRTGGAHVSCGGVTLRRSAVPRRTRWKTGRPRALIFSMSPSLVGSGSGAVPPSPSAPPARIPPLRLVPPRVLPSVTPSSRIQYCPGSRPRPRPSPRRFAPPIPPPHEETTPEDRRGAVVAIAARVLERGVRPPVEEVAGAREAVGG